MLSAHCLAAVDAIVDKTEIEETELVMLSIAVSGSQDYDTPDWTVLSNDFHLAGTSQARESVEITNGRVRRYKSWNVYLIPKRLGTLTIPSFSFGNENTEPITIMVRELDPVVKQQIKDQVFLETTIEPEIPYVQAAIHVTRRLYYTNNVQVRPEQFAPLSIDDALVLALGDVKRSFSIRGDSRHNVLIRRSVVFAEKSGNLTIPESRIMVRISLDNRDITYPVMSKKRTVSILPSPKEFPADQSWFPASDVRISDSLATSDLEGLRVGDSILRQVEITAVDSHSTGIPQIELHIPDSVRRYPDPPKLSDSALIDSVVGKRTQSETLLLTRPGPLKLPKTEVVWWNPKKKQVMRTVVDERVIDVAPGLSDGPVDNQAVGASVPSEGSAEGESMATSRLFFPPWQILLLLGIAVGMLVVVSYLILTGRFRLFGQTSSMTANRLLRRRLASEDPSEVKRAMSDWLVIHLNVAQVEALSILHSTADSKRILDRLNESLYVKGSFTTNLKGREIRTILKKIVINERNKESSSGSFLALYEQMALEPDSSPHYTT